MKKILAVLSVALLVGAVLSSLATAGSGTAPLLVQKLGLSRSGGSTATTTFQDTMTVISAADSVRTSNINTRNWDWGILKSNAATTAPIAIAKIEVWIDPGTTGYVNGDSLNFVIEPSFDGGATYVVNGYPKALAMGASLLGNSIVMTTQNGVVDRPGVTSGAFGWGYLCVDMDGNPIMSTTANFYAYMVPDFRLKIFGDAGPIGPIHVQVIPLYTK